MSKSDVNMLKQYLCGEEKVIFKELVCKRVALVESKYIKDRCLCDGHFDPNINYDRNKVIQVMEDMSLEQMKGIKELSANNVVHGMELTISLFDVTTLEANIIVGCLNIQ